MARIPDISDLGGRRNPRSASGIVRNRAGEIFGRALEDVGETVSRVQDREREIADRRQIAEANRDVIVADSEISGELAGDADFQTHEARYRKRLGEARATAAEKIQRPEAREAFLVRSDIDVARGVEAVRKQVAIKERSFRVQSLQNDIGTITDAALREPDEAKRGAFLKSMDERIRLEQDAGTIDPADADALRRETTAKYADAWLDSLPLRDQVAALEKRTGSPVEFLPEPLRLQRYEQAKARFKTESTNDAGRALADGLIAKHGYNFAAAVAEARKHSDTATSDNAVGRLKERQAFAEHQRDVAYEQSYDAALAWVNDGKPVEDMPDNIRRNLKPSVLAQFKRAAAQQGKAGTPDGDRQFWSLWVKSQTDPQDFMSTDLAEYHADLTQAQRTKLETRKTSIMTGKEDPETMSGAEKQDVDRWAGIMAGGAPKSKKPIKLAEHQEKLDEFRRAYAERRNDFMRSHTRVPNKAERDDMLRAMITSVVVDGEKSPLYRVPPSRYSKMDLEDIEIPDDERAAAINELNAENHRRAVAGGGKPQILIDHKAIAATWLAMRGGLDQPDKAK